MTQEIQLLRDAREVMIAIGSPANEDVREDEVQSSVGYGSHRCVDRNPSACQISHTFPLLPFSTGGEPCAEFPLAARCRMTPAPGSV